MNTRKITMNTITFSWNRFLNLCTCECTENRTQWLRWYGTLTVLMLILLFIEGENREGYYFRPGVVIFSAFLFQNLWNARQRAFYLMIPASTLEKFLSRYAYMMGLLFTVCGLSFLTAWLGHGVISSLFFENDFVWQWPWHGQGKIDFRYEAWIFFTTQAVFMWGSSVWLKNPWMKTVLFHAVFGVFLLVGVMMTAFVYQHFLMGMAFFSHETFAGFLKIVPYIHACMLVVFYCITYFRFRELRLMQEKNPLKSLSLRVILGCYFLLWLCVCGATFFRMCSDGGDLKFNSGIERVLIF